MKAHDVIVAGLGAAGSAALYQLAVRGVKALGIDQFSPPHQLGSSTGDTRITRQAIGEGAMYTPLSLRSYEIIKAIEDATRFDLLTMCGGIVIASPSGGSLHGNKDFLGETVRAAVVHDIPFRVFDAAETQKKFPQFRLFGDERAYYEPSAGFLRPENCIKAQLLLAEALGAEIRRYEEITNIVPEKDGTVRVETSEKTYLAKKVILSVGSWIKNFLGREWHQYFAVSRQVQYWFEIKRFPERYDPKEFPIFIWSFQNGDWMYGFPAVDGKDGGVKIATEQHEKETDPDNVDRKVSPREVRAMYGRYVKNRMLDLGRRAVRTKVCLYTKTPDSHFVIDRHPDFPQIIVASPCSGHGFKHSLAVGEVLAEMALESPHKINISPFSLKRFKKQES